MPIHSQERINMHVTYLGGGYNAVHHGDYAGYIVITHDGKDVATIPSEGLFKLVADAVRSHKIAELEDASPAEILSIREPGTARKKRKR